MSAEEIPSHHGPEEALSADPEEPNETLRLLLERAAAGLRPIAPIGPRCAIPILTAGVRAATGGNLQPFS